jgi:ring-1,2-phenylacetyl-CoA epoxidase subunit PaaE
VSHYLGFAAADGMTPLLPAVGSILAAEPASHVTLVYGNETSSSVPLRAELLQLKDRYLARLALIFVMSRERQDVDAFNGPIDRATVGRLLERWIDVGSVDTAFISGPEAMTRDVQVALTGAGLDAARIVAGSPGAAFSLSLDNARDDKRGAVADGRTLVAGRDDVASVELVFEGKQHSFEMLRGEVILDAALRAGIDVPYSCRSGVCGTCRATLTAGKVDIEVNYALEDDEIARGAILMCQSHPLTPEIAVEVREF